MSGKWSSEAFQTSVRTEVNRLLTRHWQTMEPPISAIALHGLAFQRRDFYGQMLDQYTRDTAAWNLRAMVGTTSAIINFQLSVFGTFWMRLPAPVPYNLAEGHSLVLNLSRAQYLPFFDWVGKITEFGNRLEALNYGLSQALKFITTPTSAAALLPTIYPLVAPVCGQPPADANRDAIRRRLATEVEQRLPPSHQEQLHELLLGSAMLPDTPQPFGAGKYPFQKEI